MTDDELRKRLHEAYNELSMRDLIRTNQEMLLDRYRTALIKIRRLLEEDKSETVARVIEVALFAHPMHPDTWLEWPDEVKEQP